MAILEAASRTTICPRDCYDSCALTVERVAGEFRVRGARRDAINEGGICGKCGLVYNDYATRDRERILSPLLNVGAKGEPRFAEISWDEALERIAARIRPLLARGEAERVLYTRYDGARGLLAREFPVRFFNTIGATGVVPGSVCHTAGLAALDFVFGSGADGVDPRELRRAETILLWGINPHHSAPHAWQHWISGNRRATIVRIDPLDRQEEPPPHRQLRPRPGGDAVLAFGMTRALLDEDLIDRTFVEAHTTGFPALEAVIRERSVEEYAAESGVPADEIRAVARLIGSTRTIIWVGMGLQRQAMGGNIVRAIAMLPALTGNLFKPGAGFVYLNGSKKRGIEMSLIAGRAAGRSIVHGELIDALGDPQRSAALFCWNNNIAVSNPDLTRLHTALRRKDLFTVCLEIRPTRSCGYADIVLPAADFVEYDDVVYSYFFNTVGAQVKQREPLGRSMPNQEIFRRIAHAVGLDDPSLFEPDAEILAGVLAGLPEPTSFAELAGRGTWHVSGDPLPPFAGGLATPSGRIELSSARATGESLPATARPVVAPAPGEGPFVLMTPASFWRVNSGFLEHERIAALEGEPCFLIRPEDAAAHGLEDGQTCTLFNATGRVTLAARLSRVPPRGVLVVYKCRGEGRDPDGVEINRLMPSTMSDMGRCVAFQGIRVDLEPYRN